MKKVVIAFARDSRASSAAEFALVLPLLLIFLLGMVDVGRLMWTWNRAEMATQMGVRLAVATDPVATGITNYSFATGASAIPQGASIGTSYFSSMTCDSSTCNPASDPCVGSACGSLVTPYNSASFTNILRQMRYFLPELGSGNVVVKYNNSGIGYSGDPNGPDISPLVTVQIRNLSFQPISLMLFKASISLPSFSATLTLEDGDSN